MTPNEYQIASMRTMPDELAVNRTKARMTELSKAIHIQHGIMGMCCEAGELQTMLKGVLFYGKNFDYSNLKEECGDLLWFMSLALTAAEMTMEEVMLNNIAKLKTRYPISFTEQDGIERKDKV